MFNNFKCLIKLINSNNNNNLYKIIKKMSNFLFPIETNSAYYKPQKILKVVLIIIN